MTERKTGTPLRGKTVLITRPKDQAQEMISGIRQRGGNAIVMPMIRISDPENWASCDEAIALLGTYDALIFTSGNAVAKFLKRCELKNVFSPAFADKVVYAVGARTETLLKDYGIRVSCMPEEYSSAALSTMFQRADVRGKRFLLPKGNLGNRELPATLRSIGAIVDEVDVYRNEPESPHMQREVAGRFLRGEFDVVTFASPSAVKSFRKAVSPEMFQSIPPRTKIAVIGPTTRDAAHELGYIVDIESKESTGKGLIEAIADYYA